jgi:hypothetical protein
MNCTPSIYFYFIVNNSNTYGNYSHCYEMQEKDTKVMLVDIRPGPTTSWFMMVMVVLLVLDSNSTKTRNKNEQDSC